MKIWTKIGWCLIAFCYSTGVFGQSFDSHLLPIGDDHKKYELSTAKNDQIVNTTTNKEMSFDEMIQELQQMRIVLVAETHTNQSHHDIQLKII